MKIVLLFLLLNSLSLHAENVPLPTSVLGVDDIVQEFRGALTTKVSSLGKNYITRILNQSVVYTSDTTLKCNGYTHAVNEPVSSMQYIAKKVTNELTERVVYTGCNHDISLVEDIVTRGSDLKELSSKDFLEGKRTIDLKDNENYRLYRLSNAEGDEILKILIERTQTGKNINFFISGEKFLSMTYEFQPTKTKLTFSFFGYNFRYTRMHKSWRMNMNFTSESLSVMTSKGGEEPVVYFGENNIRLSLSSFISKFNIYTMKYTVATLASIMNYHMMYFPTTETTQTGAQSQRFLEELRIAQNRLLNNIELNLVKNLLQEYINSAEKGLIIDNRPKNQ